MATMVTPFGLINAPATFLYFVNEVFYDLLDQYMVVYLDGILMCSEDPEQHTQHVPLVLKWLCQHGLYARLEKCIFDQHSVEFLGYILSPDGLQRRWRLYGLWHPPKHQGATMLSGVC